MAIAQISFILLESPLALQTLTLKHIHSCCSDHFPPGLGLEVRVKIVVPKALNSYSVEFLGLLKSSIKY